MDLTSSAGLIFKGRFRKNYPSLCGTELFRSKIGHTLFADSADSARQCDILFASCLP
jgi:hypothetical protein